jgi:hypothetical protein
MAHIVVYARRPKRPPPKQKASALTGTAKAATNVRAIVTPTSEKQLKGLRMERAKQSASEPNPEVEAFFARNVRPGGPLPPER